VSEVIEGRVLPDSRPKQIKEIEIMIDTNLSVMLIEKKQGG